MLIIDFLKWFYWDIKHPQPFRPSGIWAYIGLSGTGKTLSMVEYLERRKELFPDIEVKVYTNFAYAGETGEIKTVQDIINADSNSIIAIDEIQTIFPARKWEKFPIEMLSVITQNRKRAKQIIFTSQDFALFDANFRRLCNFIILCNCVLKRWVIQKAYTQKNFKFTDGDITADRYDWRYDFVAPNVLREKYDTLKIIDGFSGTKSV